MSTVRMEDPDSAGTSSDGNGVRRILVVDHEPHIRRLLQVNLERQGYAVVTAAAGSDALKSIGKETPDVVLLDAMMPNHGADAVLSWLKNEEATREVPVILLATDDLEAQSFRRKNDGVDQCVMKPFNPKDLLDRIRTLFR